MWLLIVVLYAAPRDAVNCQGSWGLGMTRLLERHFENKAECLASGKEVKFRLNQAMLAPVRLHCIRIPRGLPVGAPR